MKPFLDFPTAFEIQAIDGGCVHHEKCSFWAGMLCDCGGVTGLWEHRNEVEFRLEEANQCLNGDPSHAELMACAYQLRDEVVRLRVKLIAARGYIRILRNRNVAISSVLDDILAEIQP